MYIDLYFIFRIKLNVNAIVVARILFCLNFLVSKMLLAENLRSLRVMMVIFYFYKKVDFLDFQHEGINCLIFSIKHNQVNQLLTFCFWAVMFSWVQNVFERIRPKTSFNLWQKHICYQLDKKYIDMQGAFQGCLDYWLVVSFEYCAILCRDLLSTWETSLYCIKRDFKLPFTRFIYCLL